MKTGAELRSGFTQGNQGHSEFPCQRQGTSSSAWSGPERSLPHTALGGLRCVTHEQEKETLNETNHGSNRHSGESLYSSG